MPKKLSSLAVGSKVRDTSSLYNGLPLDGIILGHNHDGTGITSFMSEKIITLKCFDAIESLNSETNRRSYGNNRYKLSNLLNWLNSEGTAGNWYVAKHDADAPPTNGNVWSNYNEYDQEAGFLSFLSKGMRDALKTISKTTVKCSVDGGETETVSAKIHLLSRTEVGLENEREKEGKIYNYFSQTSNNAKRVAYPTQPCVNKSEYTSSNLTTSKGWYYWLRTPVAGSSYNARYVNTDGSLYDTNAYYGRLGVRPAWFLSSEILVSDSPNSEGYYEIQWNVAPEISTPSTSLGDKNKAFDVEFSVTDANGDVCTASAAIDGTTIQTWNPVMLGAKNIIAVTSARLSALAVGAHTIDIIAEDSAGNRDTVQIAFTRAESTVIISGKDDDIGSIWAKPTITYQVYETADQTIAQIIEKINGKTVRTIKNPPANTDIDFDLTSWANLPDEASYICKITAENESGMTAERIHTFRKLYDCLIIESEIQQTDAAAFNVAVNALFDGGTPVIEACNNAYDDTPAWEDMTEEFLKGFAHTFTNTEKAATYWGVKVRITLLKGDSERVYLNAYGFSFN